MQDAGEPGVAGVQLDLYDDQGQPAGSTSTDMDGLYAFDPVLTGDYSLEATLPAAFDGFSPQDAGGDDALDSDVDAGGVSDSFVLGIAADNDRDVGRCCRSSWVIGSGTTATGTAFKTGESSVSKM